MEKYQDQRDDLHASRTPRANREGLNIRGMANRFLTAKEIQRDAGDQNAQSLTAIKKSINAPTDIVMAAVGWLAHKDKLEHKKIGRSVKVSLR